MTPGLVALGQANIHVPVLTPGDYPVVVTIGGQEEQRAEHYRGEEALIVLRKRRCWRRDFWFVAR